MKKKNKNLVAFIMTALVAAYCTGLTALAASPAAPAVLAGDNPLQGIADWINDWAGYVKVLVPAIGTVAIIIIGIITMTAGSQWSGKAKALMVSVIVGIAIVSYGPSIITALFAEA